MSIDYVILNATSMTRFTFKRVNFESKNFTLLNVYASYRGHIFHKNFFYITDIILNKQTPLLI